MNAIREHVEGSPFQPGESVEVACSAEMPESGCGVAEFVGRAGRVVHLEYGCGCGQSYPDDPMIGVDFDGGDVQEFWREELRPHGGKR